jgi:nicotinate-nucleotide pyrophosphorylase (carboxylating)
MKDFEPILEDWVAKDPFYQKLFRESNDRLFAAILSSQGSGYLAGLPLARKVTEAMGVKGAWRKESGEAVEAGEEIARFEGTPEQILKIENLVIGMIGKPSGIASAAQRAKRAAEGGTRLVCGGWKKHPFFMKEMALEAVSSGGLPSRILDTPFLYLDKNYVRIFGGISKTLRAVASHTAAKVIQLRGEFSPIAEEAREAIGNGAHVLMVDTGSWKDLDEVLRVIEEEKASFRVESAFAGGIKIEDIPVLTRKGVGILDIGAAILDAPWLELSYDVAVER